MGDVTVLTNGTIITPLREIPCGAVVIEDGLIKNFGPADQVIMDNAKHVIDVKGAYISPGFIDLHLHGAWGGDVMAGTRGDLELMSQGLVKGGVTSFLPTTLSGSLTDIDKIVKCISITMEQGVSGAEILGVHLEGPFLNKRQSGAQNPQFIVDPKPEQYLPILNSYPCIKRVSAAPEIPGGLELGQELKRRGIIASIAHTDATYQEILKAIESGYSHVTHIYSGMSGLKRIQAYRVAGVIESALLLEELTTEIIADGHHLPPSLIKLVLKAKGLDKVCLVTDSMAAAGLGPGKYQLGGLDVIVEASIPKVFEIPTQELNYVAKLTDRSAFASSVATMDQLVRTMVKLVGLSISDAVRLATLNPAKIQGLDNKIGRLAQGMKANLTVFDSNINILLTIVQGKIKYRNI
ncbi:MAG: N-acetylglucosamine-6-phosphate deacetylase [Bacteroidota bacterium]